MTTASDLLPFLGAIHFVRQFDAAPAHLLYSHIRRLGRRAFIRVSRQQRNMHRVDAAAIALFRCGSIACRNRLAVERKERIAGHPTAQLMRPVSSQQTRSEPSPRLGSIQPQADNPLPSQPPTHPKENHHAN